MTYKFHIRRIIMYIILLAIIGFLFLFFRSYVFLMLITLMILLPIISIIGCRHLVYNSNVYITVSDSAAQKGDDVMAGIIVENPTLMGALDVNVRLRVANTFIKSEKDIAVSLAAVPKNITRTQLPLKPEMNGCIDISMLGVDFRDYSGLVSIINKKESLKTIVVYPKTEVMDEVEKSGFYDGVSESEESSAKGSDFSEVSNIREYVPGDRIKDIHWKLTAKKDVFMVKERIRMSERQLILYVALDCDTKSADNVIDLSYNLGNMACVDGVPLTYMWWDENNSKLLSYHVFNMLDIKMALEQIYRTGIVSASIDCSQEIRQRHPEVKSYVYIGACDRTDMGKNYLVAEQGLAGAEIIYNE